MAAPTRSPRARASGGRTLILIGVLLALAAGMIVIFIVSQATTGLGQTASVVVAKQDLKANTILSVSTSDANHVLISDAFMVKNIPVNDAPANAFQYTSQDDLNVKLNDQVIIGTIYSGDILRQNDPRLIGVGTGAAGSLANSNPSKFPPGDVLEVLDLQSGSGQAGGKLIAVVGDYVTLLVTECNLPGSKDPGGCETQTTLQNLYVYAVSSSQIVVVVTPQKALQLKYLKETGKAEIVLVNPQDGQKQIIESTTPEDGATIAHDFGY